MMQTPAIARNPRRQQQALTRSLPAPVGGLNDRDSLAAMPKEDAVILDNFFPLPSKVILRKGEESWATGIGSQVESLMGYKPASGTSALFAAGGTTFYNVTASGAITTNRLNLTGAAGTFANTPDTAAISILGDLEIIACIAPDSATPSAINTIAAKFLTTGNQRSYKFYVDTTGKLGLTTSFNGTNVATRLSSSAAPFVVGTPLWVKVAFDCDIGGALRSYAFFYSTDAVSTNPDDVTWTQIGSTASVFGATTIFDSTALLEIGASSAGADEPFDGSIYRVLIYDGIGGTLAASFNASDAVAGAPTVTSADTGEVYTLQGAAAIAGSAVVTGLTNARWQHVNIATSGGNFMMAVNGSDKLRGWNGTAWWADGDGTHDITGVDTATWISLTLFKRRVWGIQKNSTKVWYLPVDSIAGAAASLDFGSIFPHGGQLMAMADWSIDAGIGIDDYAAFISDSGDVALYKGSDPTSATTWALVGVFWVGAPIGRRCVAQYGPDVLMISKDGLVPLSKALMSARVNTKIALTDKIQNAIGTATVLYGANFGWQVIQYPGESMVVLNVPVSAGAQVQYVMNSISGAWCRFTGWAANCFELFGDELYYGGNGTVYKVWQTQGDAGTNINGEALQAFSYFGNASMLKEWTLAQPLIAISSSAGFVFGINTDYDMTPPTGTASFTSVAAGQWGVGQWGTARWGGEPAIQKNWQSVNGIGYCAAMHIIAASNVGKVEWSATNFAYKPAGIL